VYVKSDGERNPSGTSVPLLVVASGVLTASFRFLATRGFNNDHFVHLSGAQQMLFGDWPTRDFIDIGRPLTMAMSAAAQYVFGRTLLSEAILVSVAFGVAASLTAALVVALTASFWAAGGAVAMEVLAFPRTYSYPKILVSAAALWCIAAYVRRPTPTRHAILALVCVIGFLFRHDLGVFAGLGAVAALMFAKPGASPRDRVRDVTRFGVLVLALSAPYVLYVQAHVGIVNYVVTTLDANTAEAGYVWPNPLTADASADARLLYVFHLIPFAALALCISDWRNTRADWRTRFIVAASVLALAENVGLIRDLLKARVPDAVVPVAVLTSWLAWRGWNAGQAYVTVATAVTVVALGFWILELGDARENVERSGLTEPSHVVSAFSDRAAMLRDRFGSDPPSRVIEPLKPFFLYVDRCTTDTDRIFLAGMIPEVAYYARRPFAGGAYEHYNYASAVNQRRVVDRLQHETVPLVLIPSEAEQELYRDLTTVGRYVRGRYVQLADVHVYDDRSIRILVDSTLVPRSRDAETGWPCFK
jgi:hypothetical protein